MTGAAESHARHEGIFWLLKLAELDEALLTSAPTLTPGITTTFQRIGREAMQPLAQAMGLTDHTQLLQRFERRKWCYVGRVAGEIVTYGWVTFDEERIGELGLTIRLRAGEAYIWDCATLPAYRGQRLYPALLAYMLRALAAEGLHAIWLGTDMDNIPSQKGVAFAGFQPIVDAGLVDTSTDGGLWIRQRPGVSEQDAIDAHRVLLGRL